MQLAASPSLFRSAEFEAFLIFHELSLLGVEAIASRLEAITTSNKKLLGY